MKRSVSAVAEIQGVVARGFEPVREAFLENFSRRNELGAACSVYQHGERVVDLWGGVRNAATHEPWEADTMVVVFSATKGLAAMTMAIAHSRGWLDYDEFVSTRPGRIRPTREGCDHRSPAVVASGGTICVR